MVHFLYLSTNVNCMLKLVINNVNTRIEGKLDLNPITANEIHEALRDELSYTPPNVEWSPSFKEGKWDGKNAADFL